MSWTDANTVRLHLEAFAVDALAVQQKPLRLKGSSPVQLPHNTLAAGSVVVQALHQASPLGPVAVTLSGESWYPTGSAASRVGSVVVADEALGTDRYVEGVDYVVRHEDAHVRRIDGGAITDGSTLQVWLLPLLSFSEGSDYDLDLASGRVTRIEGGAIADPALVYISYTTSAVGASDALVAQSISEAEAKILDRLREDYSAASTDKGLVIGATELAISQLCDDLALRALTGVGDPSADDRARRFMELADRYGRRAATTLSPFLRSPLPSSPTLSAGGSSAGSW